MSRQNRILYYNGSTLSDETLTLNSALDGTVDLPLTTTSRLYIGSDMPFNSRYYVHHTNNNVVSALSVDLWDGTNWVAAVDVLDGTSSGGKTLYQSGLISWSPDWDESSWTYDDTDEMTGSGIETGPKIKSLYWARLKVSVNLSANTKGHCFKHKFSEDIDLTTQYPELANSSLKTAYSAGKTDWMEQTMVAAEYVIQELKQMNVVQSENQILEASTFKMASVHKTAEIIFSAFGDDYKDQRDTALKNFKNCMQLKYFKIDQNANAELDPLEGRALSTFLTR